MPRIQLYVPDGYDCDGCMFKLATWETGTMDEKCALFHETVTNSMRTSTQKCYRCRVATDAAVMYAESPASSEGTNK